MTQGACTTTRICRRSQFNCAMRFISGAITLFGSGLHAMGQWSCCAAASQRSNRRIKSVVELLFKLSTINTQLHCAAPMLLTQNPPPSPSGRPQTVLGYTGMTWDERLGLEIRYNTKYPNPIRASCGIRESGRNSSLIIANYML